MTTEIKSPTYPESVSDGTISNWVKKEGENVKQDELIAEMMKSDLHYAKEGFYPNPFLK